MHELRLLHTADVHLGRGAGGLGERAQAYRERIAAAFERCVDEAIERRAHLFLVVGDLFDRQRRSGRTAVNLLTEQLRRLASQQPPVQVVILPGTRTHDAWGPESIWHLPELQNLPPNVHLLGAEGSTRLELADLGTCVHGRAPGDSPPLGGIRAEQSFQFNIGLCHASVERGDIAPDAEAETISRDDIARTGLDYLALGHWHRPSQVSECVGVPAYYPGPPEIIDRDPRARGQALFVTLRPGQPASVEPVLTGRLRCDELAINLADIRDEAGLRELVAARADPDLILSVELIGLARPGFICDAAALAEDLADRFFVLRVEDRSHPALAEITPQDYPEQLVVGRFARLAQDRIAAAREAGDERAIRIAERALQVGLTALQTGVLPE